MRISKTMNSLVLFLLILSYTHAAYPPDFGNSSTAESSSQKSKFYQPLIVSEKNGEYYFPRTVHLDEQNQKIFDRENNSTTKFFCPPEDDDLKQYVREKQNHDRFRNFCLFEKKIEPTKGCDRKVQPFMMILKREENFAFEERCGRFGYGQFFGMVFLLCHRTTLSKFSLNFVSPENRETRKIMILHKLCYNLQKKKVIYNLHRISSPLLLRDISKLGNLAKEPSLMNTCGYLFGKAFLNLAVQYNEQLVKLNIEEGNHYVRHMIMPSKDMPFYVWKQSLYHFLNVKIMPIEVSQLWDFIDERIRLKAINTINSNFHIYMGEVKPANEDVWIKIVLDYQQDIHGIAIIVHEKTPETPSCPGDAPIESTFSCDFASWGNTQKLNTELAICCPVNENIQSLFALKMELQGYILMNELTIKAFQTSGKSAQIYQPDSKWESMKIDYSFLNFTREHAVKN